MIPKENRSFIAVVGLLVLILTVGYFLLNDNDPDPATINEENSESKEVPYPPLHLLKPKEIKNS